MNYLNTNHSEDIIQGNVERITFFSEESNFCVLRVKCKGMRDLATIVGSCATIHIGEVIEAQGKWINNRTYGRQFDSKCIKVIPPNSIDGIKKYLGSGLIKGIGPAFAKKLVSRFGANIFNIIEKKPNELLSLNGIGKKRVAKICSAWEEQKAVKEIMIFLQSHGIGTSRSARIYKTYGDDSIDKIKQNPYRLSNDIHGIGFKTADELAKSIGIAHDSILRARAGVIHVIQEINTNGHCAIYSEELINKSVSILGIEESIILSAIEQEVEEEKLMIDTINNKQCIYVSWLYYAEIGVANHIKRLLEGERPWKEININKALEWVQKVTKMNLSESQKEAVSMAVNSKVVCITGGPGVGKTTIVNSIIKIIQSRKARIVLSAPTGRASKKLSESTNMKAKTIHRLLEFNPHMGQFNYNQSNPLETDLLVIDEASMVDISLMNSLLKALPDSAGVIIVGDIDQLPSVGPGKVLSDIITSKSVPTVKLTEIFRQASCSKIIINAHKINTGEVPHENNKVENNDFFIIHSETPEDTHRKIATLVSDKIPKVFKFDPINDIQILTPMNKGGLGVKSLNVEIQKVLNPSPRSYVMKYGWSFGIGDKVMQTINNYDKEVFNGDLGIIKEIDRVESQLTINFDGKNVIYNFDELDELDLAYATSIHKSQGSEYPVVIIPISMQHYMLLQRNLLYTGVTRGRKLVILIGEPKAIKIAVNNLSQNNRLTKLSDRLLENNTSPKVSVV